jgi:hypothetical protein
MKSKIELRSHIENAVQEALRAGLVIVRAPPANKPIFPDGRGIRKVRAPNRLFEGKHGKWR